MEYAKEKSWVCACNCLGLIIEEGRDEEEREKRHMEEKNPMKELVWRLIILI